MNSSSKPQPFNFQQRGPWWCCWEGWQELKFSIGYRQDFVKKEVLFNSSKNSIYLIPSYLLFFNFFGLFQLCHFLTHQYPALPLFLIPCHSWFGYIWNNFLFIFPSSVVCSSNSLLSLAWLFPVMVCSFCRIHSGQDFHFLCLAWLTPSTAPADQKSVLLIEQLRFFRHVNERTLTSDWAIYNHGLLEHQKINSLIPGLLDPIREQSLSISSGRPGLCCFWWAPHCHTWTFQMRFSAWLFPWGMGRAQP